MFQRQATAIARKSQGVARLWSNTPKTKEAPMLICGTVLWDRISNIKSFDKEAIKVLKAEPGLLMPGRSLEQVVAAALARGNLGVGGKAAAKAEALIKQNRQFTEIDERVLPDGRLLSVSSIPTIDGGFLTVYRELPPRKVAFGKQEDTDETILKEFIRAAGYGNLAEQLSLRLLAHYGSLGRLLSAVQRGETVRDLPPEAAHLLALVSRTMVHTLRSNLDGRKVLNQPSALNDYLHARLACEPNELSLAIYLNASNHLICDEVVAFGGVLNCPTDTKKVCKRAIELGSTAVIIVHNHPSGDPKPSQADYIETRRFKAALNVLDITLHDSVIVGKYASFSFRKAGCFGDDG